MNISKTVRDRAISSKFLTCRVVQESPVQRGKISIFATFGGHLTFLRKMKKCQYLENRNRSSDFERFFDPQDGTTVSYAKGKNFNVVFLPLRYSAGDTYRGSGLVIRRFQTIFGSYIAWAWENFSSCLNLTFDLYEGHMIKNNFFEVHSPPPPTHPVNAVQEKLLATQPYNLTHLFILSKTRAD